MNAIDESNVILSQNKNVLCENVFYFLTRKKCYDKNKITFWCYLRVIFQEKKSAIHEKILVCQKIGRWG